MKKFLVFQCREMQMGEEDDGAVHVRAVPEADVKTGIFVPGSHSSIMPDPVGEVEAETPEDACAIYLESRANAFM